MNFEAYFYLVQFNIIRDVKHASLYLQKDLSKYMCKIIVTLYIQRIIIRYILIYENCKRRISPRKNTSCFFFY